MVLISRIRGGSINGCYMGMSEEEMKRSEKAEFMPIWDDDLETLEQAKDRVYDSNGRYDGPHRVDLTEEV